MEQSVANSSTFLSHGDIFPDFTLPDSTGSSVSSRSHYMRSNFVVVLLPETLDQRTRTWFKDLVRISGTIAAQDARFFVIAANQESVLEMVGEERLPETFFILLDEESTVRRKFGDDRDELGMIIADRYGQVFLAASGSAGEKDLDPAEIPDWVELIACRCS